jgi:peptide/nickel transport system permease protein
MQTYILRRIVLGIPTIFAVAILVFFLVRATPGDIASQILAESQGANDPEFAQRIREDLGLTGSVFTQLGRYLGDIVQLDFGESYGGARSVLEDIGNRFPASFEFAVITILVGVIVGIPVGIVAALRQDTWIDYVLRGGTVLILAIPSFFLALWLIIFGINQFGLNWGFLDWTPQAKYFEIWDQPLKNLKMIGIPATILGINLAAIYARYVRTTMLEVMRQDYIRTAMAKGLHERGVILRHALKNALIPVVTVVGLTLAGVITGVVVLELIFGIPGLGRLFIQAALRRDYPIVQGVVILASVIVIVTNLLVDLSYGVLDPRVRESLR